MLPPPLLLAAPASPCRPTVPVLGAEVDVMSALRRPSRAETVLLLREDVAGAPPALPLAPPLLPPRGEAGMLELLLTEADRAAPVMLLAAWGAARLVLLALVREEEGSR
jgi:hypothetical protein